MVIIILLYVQRGHSALMQALYNYHDEIARVLIDKGANLDIQNEVSY